MPDLKDKKAVAGTAGSDNNTKPSIPPDRVYNIPHKPSDSVVSRQPRSLANFREREGRESRKRRLQELWKSLPDVLHEPYNRSQVRGEPGELTPEKAEGLQEMYDRELLNLCATPKSSAAQTRHIGWKEFKEFAEKKEAGKSLPFMFRHLSWHLYFRAVAYFPRRIGSGW